MCNGYVIAHLLIFYSSCKCHSIYHILQYISLAPPSCSLLHPTVGTLWFPGCFVGGIRAGTGPLSLVIWGGLVLSGVGWGHCQGFGWLSDSQGPGSHTRLMLGYPALGGSGRLSALVPGTSASWPWGTLCRVSLCCFLGGSVVVTVVGCLGSVLCGAAGCLGLGALSAYF